jgi:hypothetical protein
MVRFVLAFLGLLIAGSASAQFGPGGQFGFGPNPGNTTPPIGYTGVSGPGAQPSNAAFGPGSPGFLSQSSSTFSVTNFLLQSQTFKTTPWATAGEGSIAAPTVTANTQTAPDSTLTASSLTMPAVTGSGGGGNGSFLYQDLSLSCSYPYLWDIYVKGAVGGERLYISVSLDGSGGATTFSRTPITATTTWQRIQLQFYPCGQNVSGGGVTDFLEIGTDLRDNGQVATPAQTVYIWGTQLIGGYAERTYIPTTTATVTQSQVVPLPPGIAFRDFSSLTAYSGNPIIPQNTGTYNAGGVSNVYASAPSHVGATLFGWANCTVSGASRNNWINQCLYEGTDTQHWTDQSANNPIVTASAGTWDDHYLLHPALSPVCTTNTFCMYLSAFNSSNNWSIGLFTASVPAGPWTNYSGNPVLSSSQIANFPDPGLPSIAQAGSNVYMYTADSNNAGTFIGIWQRVSDTNWKFVGPATNPPISGDWDFTNNTGVIDPWVWFNKHGFYEMVYTSQLSTGGGEQSLGYEISADGLTWYKYQAAPILTFTNACTVSPISGAKFVGDGVFFEDGTNFHLTNNCDDAVSHSVGLDFTLPDN